MKVLLVSVVTQNSKGGIATWTDTYLSECHKYDIDCSLLNIATIGRRAKQGNAKRSLKDEVRRTKKIFDDLRRLLKESEYDVVHLNTSGATFGVIRDYLIAKAIAKKQTSAKIIVHFHCDIEFQIKKNLQKSFLKKMMTLTKTALVLNSSSYNYLKQTFGIDSIIVPNFIELSAVKTTPVIIQREISKALFVGYIQEQKGARELFWLAEECPEVNFRLIGEVHDDIKTWDKPHNLVFCGTKKREEIFEMLDDSDLFVFPTHSEGFSLALLESMARGIPSIVTNVGANIDMIENKGGCVVDIEDVVAMKKAITYMNDMEVRKEMSDWLVKKVREKYTVEEVFRRIADIYLSLI